MFCAYDAWKLASPDDGLDHVQQPVKVELYVEVEMELVTDLYLHPRMREEDLHLEKDEAVHLALESALTELNRLLRDQAHRYQHPVVSVRLGEREGTLLWEEVG